MKQENKKAKAGSPGTKILQAVAAEGFFFSSLLYSGTVFEALCLKYVHMNTDNNMGHLEFVPPQIDTCFPTIESFA